MAVPVELTVSSSRTDLRSWNDKFLSFAPRMTEKGPLSSSPELQRRLGHPGPECPLGGPERSVGLLKPPRTLGPVLSPSTLSGTNVLVNSCWVFCMRSPSPPPLGRQVTFIDNEA